MNRAPALLLWTTMALRIGALLACLAIVVAVAWGFISHQKIDLPQPLVIALLFLIVVRIVVWLAWRVSHRRNAA